MDTLEQKLAQALQREVHLQYTIASERRCNESLLAERDALQIKFDSITWLSNRRFEEIVSLTDQLVLAKQDVDHLFDELLSAEAALHKVASRTYDSSTKLFEPNAAQAWLDARSQQTKAPLVDYEAEAMQAKEDMLEDR